MSTGNYDYHRTGTDRTYAQTGSRGRQTASGRTGAGTPRTSSGTALGGNAHRSKASRTGGTSRATTSRQPSSSRPPGSRGQSRRYSSPGHGAGRGGRRRRRSSVDYRLIAVVGVILILAIAAVVYGMQHSRKTGIEPQSSEEVTTEPETELVKEVTVDGIKITGMSRDQARAEILKNYPWAMTAVYGDQVYEVANLMGEKVNALLDEIYTGEPKESYTLDTSGLEEAVRAQAAAVAAAWDKQPKNGSISKYDQATDTFVFEGEATGLAVDQEKLEADIQNALTSKKFDAKIQVTANEVQPEISIAAAQEKYKTIATYTTKTTANQKRNTNVRLAAEALNGAIVQPGEELSFNDTVGERTAAKGYQGAAAYNNGEVVEEIGGGVCQVSTTLYNAVLRAGLKISVRRSHTFEPSYVTPGQDATVSWNGPDFKFINNSSTAIGIRAKYADQTMTVSVYGIPILEEGVTYSLESTKVADLDPPAPTYEEDQTLQLDEEVQKSAGTRGSRWETRLIVKKGDEVISREIDHTTTYKGHAPVIKRNTSGVVIPTEGSGESSSAESGESAESQQPESQVPAGPGQPTVGPTTQPAPETSPSPAETVNDNGPGDQSQEILPPPPDPVSLPDSMAPGGEGSGQGYMVEPKPE